MKQEFARCALTPLSDPDDPTKYKPDPRKWTCACPAMAKNRFLVCKHLVQACHPIPSRFFAVTPARNRTLPFYSHPLLVPKDGLPPSSFEDDEDFEHQDAAAALAREDLDDLDDADDVDLDSALASAALPFDTAFDSIHQALVFGLTALHTNHTFRDRKFTASILKHGAGFFRLIEQMQDLQQRTDSHATANPNTWGPAGSATLFYRTMPPEAAREVRQDTASALRRLADQLDAANVTEVVI
jgi:hypothetical protein